MRNTFIEELRVLNDELIQMGAMIESSIANAVKALMSQDIELAKEAIEYDHKINSKEKRVESICLSLLLQQQPVASDLRAVSAAVKMSTDMERIGDHAADISEITVSLAKCDYMTYLDKMPDIANATIKMLNESIEAFVKKDVDLAIKVKEYDDKVDKLYKEIKSDLTKLIHENPDATEQAIDLIMVAKYFEKIADHAVNIANWVVFSVTGTYKDTRIV